MTKVLAPIGAGMAVEVEHNPGTILEAKADVLTDLMQSGRITERPTLDGTGAGGEAPSRRRRRRCV